MTNRREFFKIGIAASTLSLTAPPVVAGDRDRDGAQAVVALYKVLYDTRFAASVAFARRVATRGLAVESMNGDMTRFWYDDLYHRWREGPAAIAGLTAYGALFCLERLAWDHGMRVLFRAEHTAAAPDRVAHRFEGPASLLTAAANVVAAPGWAAGMADVIIKCPRRRAERREAKATTIVSATPAPSQSLFSWVIAPRA